MKSAMTVILIGLGKEMMKLGVIIRGHIDNSVRPPLNRPMHLLRCSLPLVAAGCYPLATIWCHLPLANK
jgi:hypothetical protein